MFIARRFAKPAQVKQFTTSLFLRAPTTLYSKDHEYVKAEKGVGRVGISNVAQDKLGEIIHLEIKAEVGDVIKQGDVIAEVESVKSVSEVFSPVSGKITAFNKIDSPQALNESPEDKAWIAEITLTAFDADTKTLLDKTAYDKFCAEDHH